MPAPADLKAKIQASQNQPRNILNLPPMPDGCTATDLMQRDFPEPIWIIPELLTEGLGILAGKPKTGKSWMALNLAVASASGGRALGKVKVDKGPVLYLALEDTERRLKSRLQQVLCGNMPPEGLHFQTSWPRIDQGALPLLQKWLEAHPSTRFVIIDTLAKLWPKPNGKDGSAYHADYDTVSAIKALSDIHHVSILCVTHLRKSPTEDPLEQISGSMGISGSADTLLVLQRTRGKADANLLITGRDIEEQELALRFDQITGTWCHLGGADEYRRSQEQAVILDVLKTSPEPLSLAQVAAMVGKNTATVCHLLGKLVGDGLANKVGKGKYILSSIQSFNRSSRSSVQSVQDGQLEREDRDLNGGRSSVDASQQTVSRQLERLNVLNGCVKCADCRHFIFADPPNLPGRCNSDHPLDGSRIQHPQLQHDCQMFTSWMGQ